MGNLLTSCASGRTDEDKKEKRGQLPGEKPIDGSKKEPPFTPVAVSVKEEAIKDVLSTAERAKVDASVSGTNGGSAALNINAPAEVSVEVTPAFGDVTSNAE